MPEMTYMQVLNEDIRTRLIKDNKEWLVAKKIQGLVLVAFAESPEGTLVMISSVAFEGLKSTALLAPALLAIDSAIEQNERAEGRGDGLNG